MAFAKSEIQKFFLITGVFLVFANQSILAETVVYPAPAGAIASTQYTVKVNNISSFVFPTTFVTGSGASRGAFTSFSTSVTVPVTVTTNVDIASVTIRPLKFGLTYTKTAARTITLNVPSDCNLSVEINGNVATPLFIFSNPLEVDIPTPTTPNVKYYAAGKIYTENIIPKAGQTIYIAGGAIVRGNITCSGVGNFIVRGRGILDSSVNPTMSRTVRIVGGNDITFEGVVFHSVQSWGVVFGTCNGVNINNIKVISTPDGESDALDIVGSQDVTVNGGFFRSEDDCICVKSMKEGYNLGVGNPQNIKVNGAVVFNGHRGNALEIGYELNGIVDASGHSSVRDISFLDIDIIHKGTAVDGSTLRRSAMSINNNENARVANVTYDNIRIEDCKENYLHLEVIKPDTTSLTSGSIDSVFFKNIQVVGGDLTIPSVIYGYNASSTVQNISFSNFKIGNNVITSASAMKLATNSYVKNILFKDTITNTNATATYNPQIFPSICMNNLSVVGCDSAKYEVIDTNGKSYLSGTVKSKSISIAALHSGMYLIRFTLNDTTATRKFVKK
jgi:hypothetical protein